MSVEHIDIEIISDVVCPWCYLGQRRLHLALEQASDIVTADISWKPYQLEPNAPPEGFDALDYLGKKLGGIDAVKRSHEMLRKLAAEIDLPMQIEKATKFPNTLDAHRLIHWAGLVGSEMQDKIAHALFTANFVEGHDVGDRATLVHIAGENGMDRKAVEQKLGSDDDRALILEEIRNAQKMGVSGVPCFVIDKQYAVTGAQSVEAFVNAFRQIAEMKRKSAE
jgi:predicted DsbA family dithiol-disulfide isomerase